MPPNLKPYYDAAVTADAEVQAVMADIDKAFNLGTPEGQSQAIELRSKLDTAKEKAKKANELYVSMRDASLTSDDLAANFTAPPDPAQQQAGNKKVMSRAAFDALDAKTSMDFVKSGGIIQDEVQNG